MADEHWYVFRVRSGFAPVVLEKLRRLDLEAVPADRKSTMLRNTLLYRPTLGNYVYCRFGAKKRAGITWIPGILDILGAPLPIAVDSLPHETRS